ncbi:glycine betaine ABC transporter substrate-binding protein [Anoxybacillus rupiensis]|uniref:Glycine betaine ABC transporter substrate-binding protein n=1 Tax=Anoxybacteroides rupiense TaxID=311460 RepID=A0ABD5ITC8_9BACL|nr:MULTISPECIES: glycine betaine ABC transporter substrate-binding protein [Anoxybacillus]KXG09887.1 Osmoprotectant-binding protein OsmX [Anoxybacillus sp. P3H1B]MBB3907753.1 osmoprotectant transport system substrate-binding protein [Anoxybacillus rupiensis]MDE8563455.1 glycine betaine ABC transporter substrate-binding protein [Anoxybacillus rupiensis]MED5050736.1 glycine betaine ABC transporter substrate-binding protein [Anoxybacillus rupiensis]QHC02899.1 glycine/betaine ABC transporter subst
MRKCAALIGTILLVLSLVACGTGEKAEKGKIVIAGKKFTEQMILTHLLAEYVKANTDLDVEVKDSLGGAFMLQQAIEGGDIDAYVEYTGTGYLNILKNQYDASQTPDDIYQATKKEYKEKFNITWLKPLGFNNTYALAMRKELADELGVKTSSDLAKKSNQLVFGSDAEFFERSDGYDGLVKEYGFQFKKKTNIDPDLQYEAAKNGDIDVITAYTTDARIKKYNLVVLEDDKHYFPPYYAVPIVRQEVLDANPGLEEALNKLENILSDEKMMELNGQVNIEGKQPKQVAIDFLKSEGLID